MKTLALGLTMACLIGAATSWADEPAALTLEAKIPLGEVHGRIDHLAVDARQKRLYVAELGNDSVGVVDLAARRTIRTIPNLKEPQGVGYLLIRTRSMLRTPATAPCSFLKAQIL
jgi:YVTN family beta-propeller protein